MINFLLYLSSGMILVSFIGYFIMIFLGNKRVTDSDGFNITKDILSEYDTINIIESKSYFTIYNIQRKIIKLSTNCYYGNNISSISLSLIEAGISMVDNNKNKYISLFKSIISNLKILYIFPLISILINYSTYSISDAKVSLIFVILFSIINYILIDIKSYAHLWINNNIKKVNDIGLENINKILNFINRLMLIDKVIFSGQLIMIFRFILILLNFN